MIDMKALLCFAAACTATLALSASAAEPALTDRPPRPPRGMGPPPEALVACAGKAPGNKVLMTLANGKFIAGTCQITFRPDQPPAR